MYDGASLSFTDSNTDDGLLRVRGESLYSEPVAEIASHGDGSEVLEGYVESFRGLVSDVNHSTTDLTVTWFMDGEVLCEGAAPDIDGMSLCEGLILSSTSEVSMEVKIPPWRRPVTM